MPLVIVALGIIVLLILIMKFNINTFISLIVVSFLIAFALGMPFNQIVDINRTWYGGYVRWNCISLWTRGDPW